MRTIRRPLNIVLLGLALGVSPVLAGVTTIQATAPLADHSDSAIKSAKMVAIGRALEDARAKGLRLVKIEQAVVEAEAVTLRFLATDEAIDGGMPNRSAPAPRTDEAAPPAPTPRP